MILKRFVLTLVMLGALFSQGVEVNVMDITDDGNGNVVIGLGYTSNTAISGLEVDLLHDGLLTVTGADGGAAGDASNYASGMYFVKLINEKISTTQKIILVK